MNPYLTYIKLGGLALLLALLGLQTWRIHNLKADLANCNLRNTAQVATYRAAASEQIAQQTINKVVVEAKQDTITKDIDNDYAQHRKALLDGLTATAAYGLRFASSAHPGSTQGSDLPQGSSATQGPDGPGGSASEAEDEDRVCGINTLRLIEAQKWAKAQDANHTDFDTTNTSNGNTPTNDADRPSQHP